MSSEDEQTESQEIVCRIIIEDIIKRRLNGFVEITTPGEAIIKYALIEISGIASCEFPLEKNVFKFPRFYRKGVLVNGEDVFYYTRHTLCGGSLAHKHKGVEGYEFSCGWPIRLPATWKGEFGSIKYWGKITVIESSNVFVHNQEILVWSRRDLSLEPHLKFESLIKVRRTFHFMKSLGYIDIDVWVPFSGVAIKQSIPVLCSIDNRSNVLFGSIIFVLTRIDIYRASKPFPVTKTVRTDICRIPKMVNITRGKTDYYCVLETDEHTLPTNQFLGCNCSQIIYELWVSLQGAFPRYGPLGYPNIDTLGIPIIIGIEPICKYSISKITSNVMQTLLEPQNDMELAETLTVDEKVEKLLYTPEEMDEKTMDNLSRQLDYGNHVTELDSEGATSNTAEK
ncbi:hypothetical protein HHI36_020296 [Cryptolaemus montrouzieri]|uniref:Arrestin C-terminal-like domain-containing protein n=1 Tax=Cryptolaemus montrouzieri TaxID=559131 RepID=A0ABD2NA67_9CUCU